MNFGHYFAEASMRDLPGFQDIEKRFPALQWIEDYQQFHQETVHREKRCVILARKRGRWLRPFHCYSHNQQYRYMSLDLAEGCAFDCVYCYLQTYLNHGALVLFTNIESIESELQECGDRLWIST